MTISQRKYERLQWEAAEERAIEAEERQRAEYAAGDAYLERYDAFLLAGGTDLEFEASEAAVAASLLEKVAA
jgi:hypothetical protein